MAFNFVPSDPLFMDAHPGDYKTAMASHGGLPTLDHRTTFFCAGPAVKPGAAIHRACIVDEAPTMARNARLCHARCGRQGADGTPRLNTYKR